MSLRKFIAPDLQLFYINYKSAEGNIVFFCIRDMGNGFATAENNNTTKSQLRNIAN